MARVTAKATLGKFQRSDGGWPARGEFGGAAAPSALVTATVAADIATLVADGATPTQAHVTTLNTDWATLLAAVTAQTAADTGDVAISFDTTKITTLTQLKSAVAEVLTVLAGSSILTP